MGKNKPKDSNEEVLSKSDIKIYKVKKDSLLPNRKRNYFIDGKNYLLVEDEEISLEVFNAFGTSAQNIFFEEVV